MTTRCFSPSTLLRAVTSSCVLVAVTGCGTIGASNTGPVRAGGKDTYMISSREGAFPSGTKPLLAQVLAQANKHCASMGKTMKLVSANENSGPFIYGNYPKATIIYTCQ